MKKSLFKKYLSVTSIIIVVSFLFLGTVMIVFIARYFQSEKQAQLTQNAKSMASIAGQSVVMMQDNQYLIDGSRMALFIKAFSENVDADFFLVDQSGAEMISTYSIEEDENPSADIKSRKNISSEAMQQALSGYFSATGTMNGLYSSNYYIIGVPIVTTNSSGQQVAIGAVFAASDLKVLDVFRDETIKMFLLAAVAAFMVSFCIVWTFSYKLAKPLREMAIATKHFGEGDFSVRVPVESQDEIGELASAFNLSLIHIYLFRNRKLLFESEEFSAFAAILACMVAVCTASMFIIEIVYVVSPASSVFWIGLGYMNKFISSKNGDVSFIKKWFQKKKSEIKKSETQKS